MPSKYINSLTLLYCYFVRIYFIVSYICIHIYIYIYIYISVSACVYFSMTVLFFALSGLDLMNAIDELEDSEKEGIIEWIYSLQIVPANDSGMIFHNFFFSFSSFFMNGNTEWAHCALSRVCIL